MSPKILSKIDIALKNFIYHKFNLDLIFFCLFHNL